MESSVGLLEGDEQFDCSIVFSVQNHRTKNPVGNLVDWCMIFSGAHFRYEKNNMNFRF